MISDRLPRKSFSAGGKLDGLGLHYNDKPAIVPPLASHGAGAGEVVGALVASVSVSAGEEHPSGTRGVGAVLCGDTGGGECGGGDCVHGLGLLGWGGVAASSGHASHGTATGRTGPVSAN